MAEGFLKSFNPAYEVFSAGTAPAERGHPLAVKVMLEKGIDLGKQHPKSVNQFIDQEFDYVITVCGGAKESCPVFTGNVKYRLHIGFDDPADATGTDAEILAIFRMIRDQIELGFKEFSDKIRL